MNGICWKKYAAFGFFFVIMIDRIFKFFVYSKKLQIRLAKYNLESNKHEFDDYKQRAQKILFAKENLLKSLKEVLNQIIVFSITDFRLDSWI